jgi:hypothetical protein
MRPGAVFGIVRQDPGSKIHQELVYNVDDIQRRKAEDVVLLPNDVIHVPSSLPKSMGRGSAQRERQPA